MSAESKLSEVSASTSPDVVQGLRKAMRRMAASVVVVSARQDGMRFAMSASAVTSLSIDPPSLLVCVNEAASIFPVLMARNDFAINVLSTVHKALSVACSGAQKGEARFALGQWTDDSETNVPYIVDSQASLICAVDIIQRYGTHGIFVGRVKRVALHGEIRPLIYVDGRYGVFAESASQAR
jgi:flavin reductase (DIM6/NTAB) family NADH-FMN oxidoreductase RutF